MNPCDDMLLSRVVNQYPLNDMVR